MLCLILSVKMNRYKKWHCHSEIWNEFHEYDSYPLKFNKHLQRWIRKLFPFFCMIFLKIFTFVPSFILFWVKSFSLIWWLSVQVLLYMFMLVFQMWPSFERINHAQILIDLSLFKSFFFKLLRDFFVMDKFLSLKILH